MIRGTVTEISAVPETVSGTGVAVGKAATTAGVGTLGVDDSGVVGAITVTSLLVSLVAGVSVGDISMAAWAGAGISLKPRSSSQALDGTLRHSKTTSNDVASAAIWRAT